jgi:hypothetical protein
MNVTVQCNAWHIHHILCGGSSQRQLLDLRSVFKAFNYINYHIIFQRRGKA